MNKLFLFVLFGLFLFIAACDLAVTTEMELTDVEYEDVLLQDNEVIKDTTTIDILANDIINADIEPTDANILTCETDRDCNSEKPYCKENKYCVVCLTNEHCNNNEICNEFNECQAVEKTCTKPSDCDLGFVCKDNKCVEGCNTDKDCPPVTKPNNKFCNINSENPLCVECLKNEDCVDAGLGTKCDESNICITITCDPPCNSWEHCTNEGKCELNDGACNGDKDCQLIDPTTVCDLNKHVCVFKPECTINDDCAALCPDCGGVCKAQRCECIINCPKKQVCEVCTDDNECESGVVCKGVLGTKYCQPQNCQNNSDCGGKYCVFGSCACGI